MSLADTIEAVRGGKSPEVARLESTKERTPFGERLLKAVKNVPERAVRKMAGIDDMDLPEDYSAAGGFAKDVYEQLSAPVKAAWARGKEKNAMPIGRQAVEHAKDVGTIFKEITKAGGRLATSSVDAVQMTARNKVDPIEWEKVPVLKNVPSYQRQTELKIQSGMPLGQALTEATRDIFVDVVATYGTAKAFNSVDTKFINTPDKTNPKFIDTMNNVKSPTRGHGYDKHIKAGEMKESAIYANAKKGILRREVAKDIVDDYAGQLDNFMHGMGTTLKKSINLDKVKYVDGQASQVLKETERILRKEFGLSTKDAAAEAIAISKGAYRKMVPHPAVTDYQ